MVAKECFINAIQLVPVNGSKNIPAAVLYRAKGEPLVGSEALAGSTYVHLVNEDFKVELGNADPTQSSVERRQFPTASGALKTAGELAADFLHNLLKNVREWLRTQGVEENPLLWGCPGSC